MSGQAIKGEWVRRGELRGGGVPDIRPWRPGIAPWRHYGLPAIEAASRPGEALIITRGVLTVRRAAGVATAAAGEVIFHRAGAKVVYQADEDAELVYVSHPALPMEPVDGFHPAGRALATQLAPDTPPTRPLPPTTSRCSRASGADGAGRVHRLPAVLRPSGRRRRV